MSYFSDMVPRPTPYDLAFADVAEDQFPGIQAALRQSGDDPSNRDAFLMLREVVTLIRELRPEGGLGEGIDHLAALLHHTYLFWDAGKTVVPVGPDGLAALVAADPPTFDGSTPGARYVQLPERRIWAAVVSGEPAEPLDGYFIHATGQELRVLGIFGIHPDRMGFSVVEAIGTRPGRLIRPDGRPAFSSTLPGGDAARLHALAGAEELLELGWRAWTV